MAQQNKSSNRDKEPNTGGTPDPSFNWRGMVFFAMSLILIGGAFYLKNPNANTKILSHPEFKKALAEERISSRKLIIVSEPGMQIDTIKGYLLPPKGADEKQAEPFKTQFNPSYDPYLVWQLEQHGIVPEMESGNNNLLVSALLNFLPVAFILLLLYFFFRQQLRMAGKGALSFGKSKARMMARDKNKVTFKDVAGVEIGRAHV